MSDNQSENSSLWPTVLAGLQKSRGSAVLHTFELTELAIAEQAVKDTEEAIWQAEQALDDARRDHVKAKGRLAFIKDRPTWKKILCPGVYIEFDRAYAMCMQLGYEFVLINEKIYKAGLPGEQLMDTGMTEEDIK